MDSALDTFVVAIEFKTSEHDKGTRTSYNTAEPEVA